jgi:RND family efflux transporter MFP subunit
MRQFRFLLPPGVLAALALAGCAGEAAPPPAKPPAVSVRLATVEAKPVQQFTEYVATVKSPRSTTLQPQVDGRIERILVRSGDRVTEGQPLFRLDQAQQVALLRSQEATLAARRADLEYARQQHERMRKLADEGIVSRAQLDQARSALDGAKASVEALEADVREQQVRLRYFTVTAPVAGIVGDIPVRVGGYVTTDTTLTTIGQNATLEAYVSVPLEQAPDLALGLPVVLVDRQGGAIADSKIYFISPQVNDETQSVLVKTLVENASGGLRSDQFVRARIVWSTRQAPTVPVIAVTRMGGQTFAFVAQEENGGLVARQRPIEVGEIVGNVYPVLKGLAPGDRVVVSGVQKLADGTPIAPQPQA